MYLNVSDATMLRESGELSELDKTDLLFDEIELLGTSSQLDHQNEIFTKATQHGENWPWLHPRTEKHPESSNNEI